MSARNNIVSLNAWSFIVTAQQNQRIQHSKDQRLCFSCLNRGYVYVRRDCKSKMKCGKNGCSCFHHSYTPLNSATSASCHLLQLSLDRLMEEFARVTFTSIAARHHGNLERFCKRSRSAGARGKDRHCCRRRRTHQSEQQSKSQLLDFTIEWKMDFPSKLTSWIIQL